MSDSDTNIVPAEPGPPEPLGDNGTDDDAIFAEQVRLLYEGTAAGNVIHLVVPSILVFIFRETLPAAVLGTIFLYFVVGVLWRFTLTAARRNSPGGDGDAPRTWASRYVWCLGFSGAGWSITALLALPSLSPELQVFTALIIGGMASGAVVSMFPVFKAYVAYACAAMIVPAGVYFWIGTEVSIATGSLALVLGAFLVVSAKRLNKSLIETIELRVQHQDLFLNLAEEMRNTDLLNEKLAAEIEDRKTAENQLLVAITESEQAVRAKSNFLASMSHELRTPLNSIMGYTQLIEKDGENWPDPRRSRYVDQIINSGDTLLGLISQILEYANLEKEELRLAPRAISVNELVDRCLEMTAIRAEEAKIKVKNQISEEISLFTDANSLQQIIQTLISNAVKYNSPGGSIEIEAVAAHMEGVRVLVSDTGAGIALDRQDEIFEPFNRIGKEAGAVQGIGLGLPIAKRIAVSLGGDIGFESQEGVGSTFWVEVPSLKDISWGEQANAAGSENGDRTVLYVEDNEPNMRLVEEVLDDTPQIHFVGVNDAESALKEIDIKQPNLILMDLDLPGMSGTDLFRKLRRSETTKDIPVFALTAAAMERDVQRGLIAGFDEYVTKPLDVAVLKKMVQEYLGLTA